MQKGKLLLRLASPEDKRQNKLFNSILSIICVVFCIIIYCFVLNHLSNTMYNPKQENVVYYFLIFSMLILTSFTIIWVLNTKKKSELSKLYLYENCIEGMAETKSSGFGVSLENFSLMYTDVINISSVNKFVIIYTEWQTYKVLAFNRHNEIINIIREQKEKITRYGLNPEIEEDIIVEKEIIEPIENNLPIYSYNGIKSCDKETHKKYKDRIGNAIGTNTKDGHWEVDSILNERVFVCNHCHNIIAYETDFNTD